MTNVIWQVDFYRHSQQDKTGKTTWELLICTPTRDFEYITTCPQSEANSHWLTAQFQQCCHGNLPNLIQVFRPQSLSLITVAANNLNIKVEATRHTLSLKKWLQEKRYPLIIDQPPPVPLPENLWGEKWGFVSIPAGDLIAEFAERPIPCLQIPEFLTPIHLGLASTVTIPGVVIYGGKLSLYLARWLQETKPASLNYISGAPDGLVLDADLADRWIIATFEDPEVAKSAQMYEQRKATSKGLHFLLVQPDESGVTYSGFWLLHDGKHILL
ncbi:MAG: DUF1092 family protein [Sphaerospermopsis sp. SIO1G2]|nr:DUF1092 family protein [Sphaerospermopsis sp. SIO1G2]